MINIDVRIAQINETFFKLKMLSHRLRHAKENKQCIAATNLNNLIRKNDYFHQKIAFYKNSRNAMLAFHNHALEVYKTLQLTLRKLSKKLAMFEEHLLKYTSIKLDSEVTNCDVIYMQRLSSNVNTRFNIALSIHVILCNQ